MRGRSFFITACLFEGGLFFIAIILAKVFSVEIYETFQWNWIQLLIGCSATLPMIALLFWMSNSPWKPLTGLMDFVKQRLRPLFQNWSVVQFLIVSLLAGIGEEFLFRAFLQEGLSRLTGEFAGLVLAGALFGLAHWMTPAYGIFASIIGLYLGFVWQLTDSLLIVIVAHALYDFVTLIYLVRFSETRGITHPPEDQRR